MGTKSRRNQVSWLMAGSSGRRKRGKRGERQHHARGRVQGWTEEAVGLTQAVPISPPTRPAFGGGGMGGREGGGVRGDLGQSSLPTPLPTWVLKGTAVF